MKTAFVDFQRLTLQESPGKVPPGRPPRQREVIVTGELVDSIKPGEEVEVLGVYQTKCDVSLNVRTGFPILGTEILANNVIRKNDARLTDMTEDDIEAIKQLSKDPHIRERIIASIAPALWGNREIKTALAYALFGGVPKGRSTGGGGAGGFGGTTVESLLSGAGSRGGGSASSVGQESLPMGRGAWGRTGEGAGGGGSSPHVIRGDINVLLLGKNTIASPYIHLSQYGCMYGCVSMFSHPYP